MTAVSVVIPVYRSAATLSLLVSRLNRVLENLGDSFEILLINDGSPDHSCAVIQELADQDSHVGGVNLMRNYGQHAALAAGIRASRGRVIVTLDDDLQTPP